MNQLINMNWSSCPRMNEEKIQRIYYERRKSNAAQTILFFSKIQKQMFVDVLQNKCSLKFCNIPSKTPVLDLFLIKLPGLKVCRCFHVNIAKFLRTACFIEHLCWLLLNIVEALKRKKNRTAAAISTTYAFFESSIHFCRSDQCT